MKYPSFQFYPGDWLKDPLLRMCSPSTRGIWMDWLCAMHELDRCGQLSGTHEQLARVGYCTSDQVVAAIAELSSTNTATVERDGHGIVTLTNRRMRREHLARLSACNRKRKERDPEYLDGNVTPVSGDGHASVTDMSRSLSSSSSSTSVKEKVQKEKPPEPTQADLLRGRIMSWFGQKPTTIWDEKEEKSFSKVLKLKTVSEEIDILEAYYTAKDREFRRKDPVTLMNNWNGEIVRAKAWKQGTLNFSSNGSSNGSPPDWVKIKRLESEIVKLQNETHYDFQKDPEKIAKLRAKEAELATLNHRA